MTPLLSVPRSACRLRPWPRRPRKSCAGSASISPPAKTLAIVGESGSGKSVTALSINRLVDFGGGRITNGSIRAAAHRRQNFRVDRSEREGTDTNPRRRDRHDLPGADDFAQPGAHHRSRRSRNPFACIAALRAIRRRAAARDALDRVRIPDAAQRLTYYPQPAFRRHAPAGDDRDGAGMQSAPVDCGRTHDGARRDGAGADHGACSPNSSAKPACR